MIPKHNETVLVKIKGIGFWTVYTYNDDTKSWANPFTGRTWANINDNDKWFYLPK
jgi:hypothetical protein